MHPSRRTLVLGGLALVSAGAGALLGQLLLGRRGGREVVHGTLLREPRPLPAFTLVDQRGEPFTRERLEGRWALMFFGFTHCPDICPLTLQTLVQTLRSLSDLPEPQQPAIVFVSVDPARDTPERLAEYLGYFGAGLTGVTGSEEAIAAFTRAMGVAYGYTPLPSGEGYAVDHTAALFLVNPQQELAVIFTPPHDARRIRADYRAVLASNT